MPGSTRTLPLPFGEASPPRPRSEEPADIEPIIEPIVEPVIGSLVAPSARCDDARLWLCLYFPGLPLEVFASRADGPLAILADGKKRPVILTCDDSAARSGVRPGMPINAALALSPGLEFRPRDRERERDTLGRLAHWAMRFTPVTSLDPCGALLLEIAGSVGLFGGPDALRTAAVEESRQRGHAVMTAIAPTARAALWLARSGHDVVVPGIDRLPGVLARLPVSLVGWPRPICESLRRMGVSRLGECMRLPRDGLARRIGESYVSEIDEALGRRPELRQACRQATRFCDELDLPADTAETVLLDEALQIMLYRLRTHLQVRQSGAQILWLRLRHRGLPDTLLRIGLLRPSANLEHLQELAAIHLSSVSVAAPVTAIRLEADLADVPPRMHEDLLGRRSDEGERIAGLVERLRVRLGLRAVHGLWTAREHRPEHAWEAVVDPVARRSPGSPVTSGGQRPLWILERPAPLSMRSGAPVFHGSLVLESGPERIETGWWDGRDVRRDYYTASNPRGVRVWVFNDRRAGGWYLHGLFG